MHCRVAAQRAGASWRAQAPFGSWLLQSGTTSALKSRYSVYYGTPSIMVVKCTNANAVEARLKREMRRSGFGKRELVDCTPAVRALFFKVTKRALTRNLAEARYSATRVLQRAQRRHSCSQLARK